MRESDIEEYSDDCTRGCGHSIEVEWYLSLIISMVLRVHQARHAKSGNGLAAEDVVDSRPGGLGQAEVEENETAFE